MKIFLYLGFSHIVGDFLLRNKFLDFYKKKNILVLAVHCFIWSCCISFVLDYFGLFELWKFGVLFFGHLIIDYVKGLIDPNPGWSKKDGSVDISIYKILDQLAHGIQLLIVMLW